MEEKIKEKIEGPLKSVGINLVSVTYGIEDNEKTLFVTIDSEEEVDTNMCVKATHIIDPLIDELNLIDEEYILDVSSKGEM